MNFKLFFSFVIFYLVPNLYFILRVHFLGELSEDQGINIASQLVWVNLIYEVIDGALLVPLYFLIGRSIGDPDKFRNKVSTTFIVIVAVYSMLSISISLFAEPLCLLMAQKHALIKESISYLRYETVASVCAVIIKYSIMLLLLLGKYKIIFIVSVLQVSLTMFFDTLLISNFSFSLNIGVNGIAITNILSNTLTFILVFTVTGKKLGLFSKKLSYAWIKEWGYLGTYSGLESLIRNLSFSYIIIRMVNLIQEQGNYWLANNFIWSLLLVPILALSELIKRESAENLNSCRKKIMDYSILTIIIIALWVISMPTWRSILRDVMNIQNYETVFWLIRFQVVFYILFAFNNIFTSILYGRSKTKYLFYKSILISGIYYCIIYIAFRYNYFIPSLKTISIIYGCGIILDTILTIYFYKKTTKEEDNYQHKNI